MVVGLQVAAVAGFGREGEKKSPAGAGQKPNQQSGQGHLERFLVYLQKGEITIIIPVLLAFVNSFKSLFLFVFFDFAC